MECIPAVINKKIKIDDNRLSIKAFDGCSDEWKHFIFANRVSPSKFIEWGLQSFPNNQDKKYDVVIDETADVGISKIVLAAELFSDGDDLEEYIEQIGISSKDTWGNQISFHSQDAIDICVLEKKIIRPLHTPQ